MFIRFIRQYTCRRILPTGRRLDAAGSEEQQGFASIAAFCLMMVMLGFGLALLYFVRQAWSGNAAYQQETAMRMAAEGAVEQEARLLERTGQQAELLPVNQSQQLVSQSAGAGIRVVVTGIRQSDAVLLVGCALWRPEEDSWERKKIVRGILRKIGTEEDTRYVWCGWTQ